MALSPTTVVFEAVNVAGPGAAGSLVQLRTMPPTGICAPLMFCTATTVLSVLARREVKSGANQTLACEVKAL